MYYSKFDELGNQTESMLVTEDPGDGWYQVGDDIVGKRFKFVDGEVVEMTSEEIESENDLLIFNGVKQRVRDQRAKLLVDSDWTVNPQVPLSEEKAAAWSAYRQALRDLPSNITLEMAKAGTDLSWPVPPS
jgi:hypothetical protein